MGSGRGRKLPHHLSNRGEWSQQWQRGNDAQSGDGAAKNPTEGHGGKQRQRRDPAQALRRRRRRQRNACAGSLRSFIRIRDRKSVVSV